MTDTSKSKLVAAIRAGKMAGADLRRVNLAHTDLSNVKLTDAKLWDANLSYANLARAAIAFIRAWAALE